MQNEALIARANNSTNALVSKDDIVFELAHTLENGYVRVDDLGDELNGAWEDDMALLGYVVDEDSNEAQYYTDEEGELCGRKDAYEAIDVADEDEERAMRLIATALAKRLDWLEAL